MALAQADWAGLVTLDLRGPRGALTAERAEALCAPVLAGGRADYERVVLSTWAFSREAAAVVARALARLPRLRSLVMADIIAGRPTAEGLAVYRELAAAFAGGKQLEEVDLSANAFPPQALVDCGRILADQPGLQRLYLCSNGISAETAQDLARLLLRGGGPTALRVLHTEDNMGGGPAAVAYADIVAHSPHLVDFKFASSRGSCEAGEALARAFARTPALQKLCLRDNSLQPATCAALAASLPSLPALTHLDLGDIAMQGAGLAALAHALRSGAPCRERLRFLDVSTNELEGARDAGVLGALVAELPALETLLAGDNAFGASGAAALGVGFLRRRRALAGAADALATVDLCACELGSAGAVAVARAALGGGGSRLTRLAISRNGVTPAGLARARSAVRDAGLAEGVLECAAGEEDDDAGGGGEPGGAEADLALFADAAVPHWGRGAKPAEARPRPAAITQQDEAAAQAAMAKGALVL